MPPPLVKNPLVDLQVLLHQFVKDRQWEQFHTPKNLIMALTGEVGELAEHFQWLTPEEASQLKSDPLKKQEVAHEMADVFSYLLRLADVLDIDLDQALRGKIALNAKKYPVEWARGHAKKYTEKSGKTSKKAPRKNKP